MPACRVLVAVRVQATDDIGRFETEEASGVRTHGILTHNRALSAGLKLAFSRYGFRLGIGEGAARVRRSPHVLPQRESCRACFP
jgi:hypothetical protein